MVTRHAMSAWGRFWGWYESKILGSVIIIAIIQFIQIPHMVWNADLYLGLGVVSKVHPIIDWLLYGVDLIEIVSIINVGMIMYSLMKKRRARGDKAITPETSANAVKQVIVVRTDLEMGKGKIAAQVGHACVMCALRTKSSNPDWFKEWQSSQAKVVLRVNSLSDLEEVWRSAAAENLPWDKVSDAGLTQLEPGTVTCVAIGPAPDNLIDKVTGKLHLL